MNEWGREGDSGVEQFIWHSAAPYPFLQSPPRISSRLFPSSNPLPAAAVNTRAVHATALITGETLRLSFSALPPAPLLFRFCHDGARKLGERNRPCNSRGRRGMRLAYAAA
ncbi:hypothetical protein CC85DRAFT_30131 [Cutaneotrichosporon oleaginosum]|uniref:Uncharacterized protein n=1 Tax=Cutaneotrichosporon oleaginosum TaxID=879819 RepID=A0A0J0XSP3_9TREE|nr:uncharacterized protein CC85DRAFT_30131 [Cutaneotrichosporon oleaginosum]KLT44092.1 hypothetical protein CC85DRAFT_30131 [Cutaneotrichosporon oleaginosum]TXT09453.1 hypothetical protein COLE_03387 [Cutaneotrichosporon oleaginosum]